MRSSDPAEIDLPVGAAIIEAVAEKAGVEPTELPILHKSVDVDAIETLFESTPNADARTGRIQFPYAEFIVTVEFVDDESRTIRVEPIDSTSM